MTNPMAYPQTPGTAPRSNVMPAVPTRMPTHVAIARSARYRVRPPSPQAVDARAPMAGLAAAEAIDEIPKSATNIESATAG